MGCLQSVLLLSVTSVIEALPAEPRPFFIDALNVAYWCGRPPSLRLPLALMTALLAEGYQAVLFFDASARYQLGEESDLYAQLMQVPDHFVEVPSGRSADTELLKRARATGACIVSRDHFRDHRRRYRKLIDDPARLLMGFVSNEHLLVPALALDVLLPATALAAWRALQSHLLHKT